MASDLNDTREKALDAFAVLRFGHILLTNRDILVEESLEALTASTLCAYDRSWIIDHPELWKSVQNIYADIGNGICTSQRRFDGKEAGRDIENVRSSKQKPSPSSTHHRQSVGPARIPGGKTLTLPPWKRVRKSDAQPSTGSDENVKATKIIVKPEKEDDSVLDGNMKSEKLLLPLKAMGPGDTVVQTELPVSSSYSKESNTKCDDSVLDGNCEGDKVLLPLDDIIALAIGTGPIGPLPKSEYPASSSYSKDNTAYNAKLLDSRPFSKCWTRAEAFENEVPTINEGTDFGEDCDFEAEAFEGEVPTINESTNFGEDCDFEALLEQAMDISPHSFAAWANS